MVKMDKRYMLRDQVSKEDREFMQRLYRRAAKPTEQLDIICDLFPYHTKKTDKSSAGAGAGNESPGKTKGVQQYEKSNQRF